MSQRKIEAVLDASAVLAYLLDEHGGDKLAPLTAGNAAISTVNIAEAAAVLVKRGLSAERAPVVIQELRLTVLEFSERQAFVAASLAPVRLASRRQLSLGDRACIALAAELDVPAVTADRAWAEFDLPAAVALIR